MFVQLLNYIPTKNSVDVDKHTPISFRIVCNNGININALNVFINGTPAILNNAQFQPGFHGKIIAGNSVPTFIDVNIKVELGFLNSQLVNIHINGYSQISEPFSDILQFVTSPDKEEEPIIAVAVPKGGIFTSSKSIALTSQFFTSSPNLALTSNNISIYYTTDGTIPNLDSNLYSSPIDISSEGVNQLKFFGINSFHQTSRIISETYIIDTIPPITSATPQGGTYFTSQTVAIEANESATIFFTTTGQIPTTNSLIYKDPIQILENKKTILSFFGIDLAGNIENYHQEIYDIQRARNNILVQNVRITYPYIEETLDILWDDMYPLYTNIIGYNVYRCNEIKGVYQKINDKLVTANQYRDTTLDVQIVQEDVSEQFRRTVSISRNVNDDFSTPDFDHQKWHQSDQAQLLFQDSNAAIFSDKAGLSQESKVTSKFKLMGDFDIQVGFNFYYWLPPTEGYSSIALRVKTTDKNFIQVSRDLSQANDNLISNRLLNGNPDLPIVVQNNPQEGIFRITRVGNEISTYFLVNQNFNLIETYQSFTDDAYVELVGKSANVPIEVRWTNFIVNSGNPVIIEPLGQLKEYFIQVSQMPIVDSSNKNKSTDDINQVSVTIDGKPASIEKVMGYEGLIQLKSGRTFDEIKQKWVYFLIPNEYSTVLVNYKTILHTTKINLRKFYYYKVTAVTNIDETDVDISIPYFLQPDRMTYIFEEAIRRNSWILDNGGERVLLYLKKTAGKICHCVKRDIKERARYQADKDCPTCFGTNFEGGYDGPYPIRIATPLTEQKITQTDRGLSFNYQTDTWTGPTPFLTQRDMIVRRNGDRVLLGPITAVEGPGGMIVQQHFSIEVLDRTDIRYRFGILPLPNQFSLVAIDKTGTEVPAINAPEERENLETDKNRINVKKGRTIFFENVNKPQRTVENGGF